MKIVIPDPINIPSQYIDELNKFDIKIYDSLPRDSVELLNRLKDAEIATANYIDITPAIIDQLPKLKYLIIPAVGYEWVDVSYAANKGIVVLNCPTHNSQAVAEHAFSLLFALNRKTVDSVNYLRDGNWGYSDFLGHEVSGKKILIVGYGNIGKRIEKMAVGLGMSPIHIDSKTGQTEIDSYINQADVLCVCAPLNNSTRSMINEVRINTMKKSAVLINVGRGSVIDQVALYNALKNGVIRGAGLDVFSDEPLTEKPNSDIVELALLPNVVATPHIAYYTEEMQDRLGAELLEDIRSCIDSKPINKVS